MPALLEASAKRVAHEMAAHSYTHPLPEPVSRPQFGGRATRVRPPVAR